MPVHHDDEHFERYLKQFRPLAPEPLASEGHSFVRRRPVLAACVATAAVAAVLLFAHLNWNHSPVARRTPPPVGQITQLEPLTIGRANASLAHAASFKAGIDRQAFQVEGGQTSKGEHSALAVLSKEPSL